MTPAVATRPPTSERPPPAVRLAVALAAGSVLLGEVALTRLLSVRFAYHYVFAVIAVALLGLGLGATAAALDRRRAGGESTRLGTATVAAAAALAGLATVLVLLLAPRLPVALAIAVAVLPFPPAGLLLARLYGRFGAAAGTLYAADLAGAALAVLLALPLMGLLGVPFVLGLPPALMAGAGLLLTVVPSACAALRPEAEPVAGGDPHQGGAVAPAGPGGAPGGGATPPGVADRAALAAGNRPLTWWPALLLAAPILTAVLGARPEMVFAAEKPIGALLRRPGAEVVFTRWDAFARVDVVGSPALPDERAVFVDGGAASSMLRLDNGSPPARLAADLGNVPYTLGGPPQRTLVIGAGGGEDVVRALVAGRGDTAAEAASRQIDAIEISPGVVAAVAALGIYNGDLTARPGVRFAADEGRSWLRRHGGEYDLIALSLVTAEAADPAGLALAENYVYTVEAFGEYLDHLAPGGRLALRLHDEPYLERAYITALLALTRRGEDTVSAARHLVALTDAEADRITGEPRSAPLLLVWAEPLDREAAQATARLAADRRFRPLFIPYVAEELPFAIFSSGRIGVDELIARVPGTYFVPTSDDRPFFYLLDRGLPSGLALLLAGLSVLTLGVAAAWLLGGRPAAPARRPVPAPRSRARRNLAARAASPAAELVISVTGRAIAWYGLLFGLLGAGYAGLQVGVQQRLALPLGHPTLALAVGLAGLLGATAVGSVLSARVRVSRAAHLAALASLAAAGAALIWAGPAAALLSAVGGQPLPVRLAAAVALVIPTGIALGTLFPSGLRLTVSRVGELPVPRLWATNTLTAVVGSVAAISTAILWGFGAALLLAAGLYLAAAAVFWRLR